MRSSADVTPRRTILVVDDDPDLVGTLCDILELRGWDTIRGYDGDQAVQLASVNDVDWILMDVRMPRRTGVEALEAIRRVRPSTRAVLMTAFSSQEIVQRAALQGNARVLSKPVDPETLLSLIERS